MVASRGGVPRSIFGLLTIVVDLLISGFGMRAGLSNPALRCLCLPRS